MDRRQFMALAGGAAVATSGSFRVLAQASAGTVTYGQSTAVLTLDSASGAFTGYPAGYEAALCIYDRLLDFDADMKIVPQLATSYEMSPDLKSMTLKLRQGVVFHDGTPCDAAAVKFSIERMMDKKRNTTNRPLWDPLVALETPDESTIVLRTADPFAALPNSLAHGSGAIVSPANVAKHGETGVVQNPVGAGPYMVESFKPGQELVLKAFDKYWGGKQGAERLVFRSIPEAATRISALRTGAVDVIDAVPVQLVQSISQDPNVQVLRKPGLRPFGIAFNFVKEPLQDHRLRQALNLAVPVDAIAQRVFFGFAKAPDSPLAFDTAGHKSVGKAAYDQARAKALLTEAGYQPGAGGVLAKDGRPLALTLIVSDGLFPGDIAVSEIVVASLKQVGVDVAIQKIERGAYFDVLRQDRSKATWDLAYFGFNPSNAAGLYHMESLFKSNRDDAARPDVWNFGRYRNEKVDAALREANTNPDESKRLEALGEAQRLVWEDAPYLWLQVNENVSAMRKGVSGVELWPIVFTSLRKARVA
jgi:ABC-type transport system substrate-binding protein